MDDVQARLIAEQLGRIQDAVNARIDQLEGQIRHHSEMDQEQVAAIRQELASIKETLKDHEDRLRTNTDGVTSFRGLVGAEAQAEPASSASYHLSARFCPEMASLVEQIKPLLKDPCLFAERVGGITLRRYQAAVVNTVVGSILGGQGLSIVVVFPRQSGKNEVQAQIETYLLTIFSELGAEIIKVSPTWKPQSLNAMRRLERALVRNRLVSDLWRKEQGYIYRIGQARVFFLSGAPEANIVGATASTLLEVDEAQDVTIAKFDKDIAPMAASTNATRVFWGTAWTSRTLLARELRAAREAEQQDGRRRVFHLSAEEVGLEVPAYAAFVAEQVARLGRSNPMVRTQFFSEEIDAEGGLFPAERTALMAGSHPALTRPVGRAVYAMLVDVGGEFSAVPSGSGGASLGGIADRDSTALTIVEVDLATVRDPLLRRPTYRVVFRRAWLGVKHTVLYGELRALAEGWRARKIVIDATGVGAGLAGFLEAAFGEKVIKFVFSLASKSKLGWDFLSVIDSGRWKEPFCEGVDVVGMQRCQDEFFHQLASCTYEVLPGPARVLRWGVPDGARDPANGEPVHDDWILSAALCAALEDEVWAVAGPHLEVKRDDPLKDMDRGF